MRAGAVSRLAHRMEPRHGEGVSRRQFLQTTLGAAGYLLLGDVARATGSAPRVVIIGAGFGGLSTAFQLHRAGAKVVVLEARNRIGGRVLSLDRFVPGAVVEGGAELIGSNHPTWMAYARHFGLTFRDVTPLQDDRAPIILQGRRYEGKALTELWKNLGEALALMNADARTVDLAEPWKTPDAARLDRMSLAEATAAWPVSDSVRRAALTVMGNDDATRPERESYLGALATIAGGGFEQFWTESEVYRCRGGNQQLAFRLAETLGDDRLRMNTPIAAIDLQDSGVTVRSAAGERFEGDVVVLTAPPSTWDSFVVSPELPAHYRPSTGPAIKYLSRVSRPFWLDSGLQPNALTDTPVGETWEGTDAQRSSDEEPACLTVFSGGAAASDCLDFPADKRHEKFAPYLEALYPGYEKHFQKGMFMGWPREKWTRCGYSCPAPGEVTGIYPHLRAGFQDRLFFAGEYSSLLFTGYMEGGLHSGAELAHRLAASLNLEENYEV